ncbi:hypothetical protein A5959_23390 [Escherichia coli]|nr:hypothetical protein A5959_23390 [Escherichia coli]
MLPSETMIWQPEFTDKTLSRKPGAVHRHQNQRIRAGGTGGHNQATFCDGHYRPQHGPCQRPQKTLVLNFIAQPGGGGAGLF